MSEKANDTTRSEQLNQWLRTYPSVGLIYQDKCTLGGRGQDNHSIPSPALKTLPGVAKCAPGDIPPTHLLGKAGEKGHLLFAHGRKMMGRTFSTSILDSYTSREEALTESNNTEESGRTKEK